MKVLILFSSIRQCTVMIQRLVTNSTVSSERIRTRMYSMHHIYRKYVCVFTANLILLLNIKVSFAINISLLNVLHFIEKWMLRSLFIFWWFIDFHICDYYCKTALNSCRHSCFIYLWEGFSIRWVQIWALLTLTWRCTVNMHEN